MATRSRRFHRHGKGSGGGSIRRITATQMPKKAAEDYESEISIERPYGGRLVFRARQSPEVDAFFAWARDWFKSQPQELELIPTSNEERSAREGAMLFAAGEARLPTKTQIRVRYETLGAGPAHSLAPVTKDKTPATKVVRETYRGTAAIERRSLTNYIISRADERVETKTGLSLAYAEGESVAVVEMRHRSREPSRAMLSAGYLARIKEIAGQLSPLDDDLLDILIANIRENGVDGEGSAEIALSDIIEARERGIGHRVAASGAIYRDGIDRRVLDEVFSRLEDLERLFLYVGPVSVKGKPAADYVRIFTIRNIRFAPSDLSRPIGIVYQFTNAADMTEISAPTRLLRLDSKRQAPMKKLGRYFLQRADDVDPDGRIVRSVERILNELHRVVDRDDPKKSRAWLEKTLDGLVAEQIIGSWGYMKHPKLPRYGWVDQWLTLQIFVKLRAVAVRDADGLPGAAPTPGSSAAPD